MSWQQSRRDGWQQTRHDGNHRYEINPRKTGVCEYLERQGGTVLAPLSIFNLEALNGYVVYSLEFCVRGGCFSPPPLSRVKPTSRCLDISLHQESLLLFN